MFFVNRNTLQLFHIFEELMLEKTIYYLVTFEITGKSCLKLPLKTRTLKLNSDGSL